MGERLELKDFDILGIINLKEVQGIEKYVTPVEREGKIVDYLSRSKEYYNVKSMTELALEREELKQRLTRELSKRNFVILENMLNCSGKVYFKMFERYIETGKNAELSQRLEKAKRCLIEDVRNILVILDNKGLITINEENVLPAGYLNSEKRSIEMDNKAMLYTFAKSLKMKKEPKDVEVVTPGYGSIYIGPFFKAMYGYDFTNTLKSKYIDENNAIQSLDINALMSSERAFEDGKLVLALDDNIGTGATMIELKKELRKKGVKDILLGAIQYNWRNYYRVSTGDKKGIDRFNIDDFDILTPLNYAGHKLYKHAIGLLHSSGNAYIDYLRTKSYRKEELSDLDGSIIRSKQAAEGVGLSLGNEKISESAYDKSAILPQYKDGPYEIINPISKRIVGNIIENVEETKKQSEKGHWGTVL